MQPPVNERKPFRRGRDFVATMASLASAGFGVMAALAWNEAIKEAVDQIFPQGNGGIAKVISLFVYAALVTAIAVIVVNSLARLTERLGGEKRL